MVDWVNKDPKQHLIDFRLCQCNHFSQRNVPSCYEISWKHLFKLSLQTAMQSSAQGAALSVDAEQGERSAGSDLQGGGLCFWISIHRLRAGLHSPRTSSPSVNSSSKLLLQAASAAVPAAIPAAVPAPSPCVCNAVLVVRGSCTWTTGNRAAPSPCPGGDLQAPSGEQRPWDLAAQQEGQ